MSENWSEAALEQLYRQLPGDASPGAIDAPVLAAARTRARQRRLMRRYGRALPWATAAVAVLFWSGLARHAAPTPQIFDTAEASLRAQLLRAGTEAPETDSVLSAELLRTAPFAESEGADAVTSEGEQP